MPSPFLTEWRVTTAINLITGQHEAYFAVVERGTRAVRRRFCATTQNASRVAYVVKDVVDSMNQEPGLATLDQFITVCNEIGRWPLPLT